METSKSRLKPSSKTPSIVDTSHIRPSSKSTPKKVETVSLGNSPKQRKSAAATPGILSFAEHLNRKNSASKKGSYSEESRTNTGKFPSIAVRVTTAGSETTSKIKTTIPPTAFNSDKKTTALEVQPMNNPKVAEKEGGKSDLQSGMSAKSTEMPDHPPIPPKDHMKTRSLSPSRRGSISADQDVEVSKRPTSPSRRGSIIAPRSLSFLPHGSSLDMSLKNDADNVKHSALSINDTKSYNYNQGSDHSENIPIKSAQISANVSSSSLEKRNFFQSQKSRTFSSSRSSSFTENDVLVKRNLVLVENTSSDIDASRSSSPNFSNSLLNPNSISELSMFNGDEDSKVNINKPFGSRNSMTSSLGVGSIQEELEEEEDRADKVQSLLAPDSNSYFNSPIGSRNDLVLNKLRVHSQSEDADASPQPANTRPRRLSINPLATQNPFAPPASTARRGSITSELASSSPSGVPRPSMSPALDVNPMSSQRRASRRDTIIGLFQQKMNAAKNTIIAETSYIRRPMSSQSKTGWQDIHRSLQWAFVASKFGRNTMNGKMKGIAEPSNQKQQTLTQILKVNPTKLDEDYLKRIEKLLSEPAGKRTYLVMEELEKLLLLRVKDYEKFNEAERTKICQVVRFDAYPKNTVILWEEHLVTCFYFVLSGQLEIFKLNKGTKLPLVLWNQGMALGHARIKVENATRSACATTTVDTVLLTVDRVDYMKIVQEVEQDLHPKLLLLGDMSVFVGEKDLFEQVSPFMKVQHFQKGQVILEEGEIAERIFWIITGNCSVSKIVPFVSISVPGPYGSTTNKYKLEAFSGLPIRDEDRKIDYQLEIQELGTSDWFPSLEAIGTNKDFLRYDGAEKLQKDAYLNHYGKAIIRNDCTIKATSKMVVVSIPFFDFINHCPKSVLFKMITEPAKHNFSLSILQEQFLAQKSWDSHKRHVREEIHNLD